MSECEQCGTVHAEDVVQCLTSEDERLRYYEKLVTDDHKNANDDGIQCLPDCDSYAHNETCPFAYPTAAYLAAQAEVERLRDQVQVLKLRQERCRQDSEKVAGLRYCKTCGTALKPTPGGRIYCSECVCERQRKYQRQYHQAKKEGKKDE